MSISDRIYMYKGVPRQKTNLVIIRKFDTCVKNYCLLSRSKHSDTSGPTSHEHKNVHVPANAYEYMDVHIMETY